MANIKNIFNNAAKNTGVFYNTFAHPEEEVVEKSIPERVWDAAKEAAKSFGKDSYGNRIQAYNNYLNTLKYVKQSGQFSIARGRVSTAPTTSPTGAVGKAKTTSFEDQLEKWNNRFRKFAISRYYESLTGGK